MRLIITDRTKIIYRAGEVSVHRACCKRATQPFSLGGGGTIYSGSSPADVTTLSPRLVAGCLLTRSMLIKNGKCMYCRNVFTVICNIIIISILIFRSVLSLRMIERPHDKTNKKICSPSEDSGQPGHPPSLVRVFAVRSFDS